MSASNLDRSHPPGSLSMVGGAAQGGSAKPKEEREAIDRKHERQQEEHGPAGAGSSPRQGSVGGTSNDNRTDEERASDARGH